jgi:hypothetical protein
MVAGMKRLVVGLTLMLLMTSLLSGQEASGSGKVPRRVLLSVSVQQGGSFTDKDRLMIGRSLLAKLQQASKEIILVEPAQSEQPGGRDELTGMAQNAGADAVVAVTLEGSWPSLKLLVSSFDLLSNQTTLNTTVSREGYSSIRDLSTESWDDLAAEIAGKYPMVDAAAAPAVGPAKATLTVKAQPGTVIMGLGAAPLTVGSDGSVVGSVTASREHVLRASLSSYYPTTQRLFISADREIAVTQSPNPRWSVEASLQNFGYPGVDLTWFMVPDQVFLKLGLTSYAVGLALTDTEVLYSAPLAHLFLRMGFYLNPEDSAWRFYAGVGAFTRVVWIPGSYFGFDPLSAWGAQALFGVEIPSDTKNRAFFEWTPTIYATGAAGLFASTMGPGKLPLGWQFANTNAFNFLSFRIGYRWLL